APPTGLKSDWDDADALSEAVAIARGPPAHAGGIARCRVGRLCRRLSEPVPVQPRIHPALRKVAASRRRRPAPRPAGCLNRPAPELDAACEIRRTDPEHSF